MGSPSDQVKYYQETHYTHQACRAMSTGWAGDGLPPLQPQKTIQQSLGRSIAKRALADREYKDNHKFSISVWKSPGWSFCHCQELAFICNILGSTSFRKIIRENNNKKQSNKHLRIYFDMNLTTETVHNTWTFSNRHTDTFLSLLCPPHG